MHAAVFMNLRARAHYNITIYARYVQRLNAMASTMAGLARIHRISPEGRHHMHLGRLLSQGVGGHVGSFSVCAYVCVCVRARVHACVSSLYLCAPAYMFCNASHTHTHTHTQAHTCIGYVPLARPFPSLKSR